MDILHSKDQGNYRKVRMEESKHHPYHATELPRYPFHIYIRKDQLLYDIDAQISIVSRSRRNENNAEQETLTNGTSEFQGMFARWMDNYLGLAKGIMSAFVMEPFQTGKTNFTRDTDEVDIELAMPEYWDPTVLRQLTNAVHNYIVVGCLYEYFSLSLSSKDPITVDKAEQVKQEHLNIKRFVNAAKPGHIHKILKPF